MKKARPKASLKGRAPTDADLEDIRHLFRRAGDEPTFNAWVKKALGKPGRGRQAGWSPYEEDDKMIIMFAKFMVAKGLVKKFHTAVRFLIGVSVKSGSISHRAEESTIGRIANKSSTIKNDLPGLTEAFPHLLGRTRLQIEKDLGQRRVSELALAIDPKDPHWDVRSHPIRWRTKKRSR